MSSQDRAKKKTTKKKEKKKNTKIKICVGGDQSSLFALSDL